MKSIITMNKIPQNIKNKAFEKAQWVINVQMKDFINRVKVS